MTNQEALNILARATEPELHGKLSRADYVIIQEALTTLQTLVAPPSAEVDESD